LTGHSTLTGFGFRLEVANHEVTWLWEQLPGLTVTHQ
jgi:hypothetical protein